MTVLVTGASKHGSTDEIARVIAAEISEVGFETDLRDITDEISLKDYDAVVLGSAVYMGNWLSEARDFIAKNRTALETMPVWLFSSGPIGADELWPVDDPARLIEQLDVPWVQDHAIFAGLLDASTLGFGERMIVRFLRAPEGDFRDWRAIGEWARGIGDKLHAVTSGPQGG